MIDRLSTNEAAHQIFKYGGDSFSHAGSRALAEHLEQMEDDTGTEIEIDPVAFRCDFAEYGSALEAAGEYSGFEPDEDDDEEEQEEAALAWLQDHTSVIPFDEGIIIQEF